jgi:hypothetical protein
MYFQRLIVFPQIWTGKNKDLEMKMWQISIARHAYFSNYLTFRYNLAHSHFTAAKCKVVISRVLFVLMFIIVRLIQELFIDMKIDGSA